jgi:hypothetical protein
LLQLLFNQFGFDRDGFRALVLLPVERWQILLGKNLACLPFALAAGVVFLAAVTVIARLSADVVVAAVLQLFAAHFLVCVPGNWLSVMLPYRVSQGSLKPTKMPFVTQLVMVVGHMLFPVMLLPVFVPVLAALLCEQAGWLPGFPVSLLLSVVLLVICLLGYWVSLGPTGRLLQGREKAILLAVSHDLE